MPSDQSKYFYLAESSVDSASSYRDNILSRVREAVKENHRRLPVELDVVGTNLAMAKVDDEVHLFVELCCCLDMFVAVHDTARDQEAYLLFIKIDTYYVEDVSTRAVDDDFAALSLQLLDYLTQDRKLATA